MVQHQKLLVRDYQCPDNFGVIEGFSEKTCLQFPNNGLEKIDNYWEYKI